MFDENSNCQTSATSALSAANGSMAMVNHLMNVKDSRWLQLEVCREFQRGQCSRTENECKFAHPPPHVDVQNGRVTACYDSIKVRLNRSQMVGLTLARHEVSPPPPIALNRSPPNAPPRSTMPCPRSQSPVGMNQSMLLPIYAIIPLPLQFVRRQLCGNREGSPISSTVVDSMR